jgi:hypothetical protein
MVYDYNLQASHRDDVPPSTVRWFAGRDFSFVNTS